MPSLDDLKKELKVLSLPKNYKSYENGCRGQIEEGSKENAERPTLQRKIAKYYS